MTRIWADNLEKYEKFLKNIAIAQYSKLRTIKTVEQDLPNELLPLELYYKHYWENTNFKDYDELFLEYWSENLTPHIYEFIKKYFYGCSLQFVEEGFKARLYRIWMSILTQFHFQYLWNALFEEKLESSAKLDGMGLDAVATIAGNRIGIQIKKISFRREVSDRRFTKRQQSFADIIVEVPYLVVNTEELTSKINSRRTKEDTKNTCQNLLTAFNQNFHKYDNGFVVFKENYLKHIHSVIREKITRDMAGKISYNEILSL